MSYARDEVVDVTTTSTGGATAYTPVLTGRVANIIYTPSTAAGFSTGADFAITCERSGIGLWTESDIGGAAKTVSPTQPIHDQLGAARNPSTAAPATEIGGPIWVAGERIKVVVAQGGDSKAGQFRVVIA